MKRSAIVFALALLSISASAQFKRTEDDGFKIVATTSEWIRTGMSDRHPLRVGITASLDPKTNVWYHALSIGVSSLVSEAIPEGSVLLIRTMAGGVIELKNSLDALTSQDFKGTLVAGTTIVTYTNQAMYNLSEEDLHKIATSGVQKVRVQLLGEVHDAAYKKDKWSAIISAQLRELEGLKGQGNIREGF